MAKTRILVIIEYKEEENKYYLDYDENDGKTEQNKECSTDMIMEDKIF